MWFNNFKNSKINHSNLKEMKCNGKDKKYYWMKKISKNE